MTEKAYRVVVERRGGFMVLLPYTAESVEEARDHARRSVPDARVVTDAEEVADILDAVFHERRRLEDERNAAIAEADTLRAQVVALRRRLEHEGG